MQHPAAGGQTLLIFRRPCQPLLDLFGAFSPPILQAPAQDRGVDLQAYRQQLRTIALLRLRQVGARTVDRHVDPLQQPKIHFDPERVALLVGLPVEREQPLGAAAQKFGFAQRDVILAAGVRRPSST